MTCYFNRGKEKKMEKFNSKKEALEYAAENIGKNESRVVTVDGHPALLSSTSLPIERRFREPIEDAVREFFKEVGLLKDGNTDVEDIVLFIGAEMSSQLIDFIEKESSARILSSYCNF